MNSHVKRIGILVAACGLPVHMLFGSVIGSLFAYPVLLILYAVHYLSTVTGWVVFLMILVGTVMATCIAAQTRDEPVLFVSDKVLGLLLGVLGIVLSLKIAILAFVMFHVLRVLTPLLLHKFCDIDIYAQAVWITIIAPSLIAGMLCNMVLHIIVWACA